MYHLISINCNGLLDSSSKLNILSHKFNSGHVDFLFLQETHVSDINTAKFYESKFKGKAFWSFGTNFSSGVGIIVSERISYQIDSFRHDCDGKLLVLDITIDTKRVRLINVYAPNNPADRVALFQSIEQFLATNRLIILGGDFNCVVNLKLDKIGGNLVKEQAGAKILRQWVSDYSLTDIYRSSFPDSVVVTWRNSAGVGSRLDRFYISSTLVQSLDSCGILPCSFSDHDYVYVKLTGFEGIDFGPGYWKCNNSVFDDKFKALFAGFCRSHIPPLADITLEWWDTFKIEIKKITHTFIKTP